VFPCFLFPQSWVNRAKDGSHSLHILRTTAKALLDSSTLVAKVEGFGITAFVLVPRDASNMYTAYHASHMATYAMNLLKSLVYDMNLLTSLTMDSHTE